MKFDYSDATLTAWGDNGEASQTFEDGVSFELFDDMSSFFDRDEIGEEAYADYRRELVDLEYAFSKGDPLAAIDAHARALARFGVYLEIRGLRVAF